MMNMYQSSQKLHGVKPMMSFMTGSESESSSLPRFSRRVPEFLSPIPSRLSVRASKLLKSYHERRHDLKHLQSYHERRHDLQSCSHPGSSWHPRSELCSSESHQPALSLGTERWLIHSRFTASAERCHWPYSRALITVGGSPSLAMARHGGLPHEPRVPSRHH